MDDRRRSAPAAERNREPLLHVLERVLPESGLVLEVASGTGQHACYFAERLPQLVFQPSDVDAGALASIQSWVAHAGLENLRPPIDLDVAAEPWPVDELDVVLCFNMIHIAPYSACQALVRGAGHHLRPGGRLVTYGPYKVDGRQTAESNEVFDAHLRSLDARFGVRDLEVVQAEAASRGLTLRERVPMPANNFTLVFEKTA